LSWTLQTIDGRDAILATLKAQGAHRVVNDLGQLLS